MWDPPGPGLEPVSLALAGGFLTTAPPGKPVLAYFKCSCCFVFQYLFRFIHILTYCLPPSCISVFTSGSHLFLPESTSNSSLVCCSRVLTTSGLQAALDQLLPFATVLSCSCLGTFSSSTSSHLLSVSQGFIIISCLTNPAVLWSKTDVDSFILKTSFLSSEGKKGIPWHVLRPQSSSGSPTSVVCYIIFHS